MSLINPWLYLLSTICAHSYNFPIPQNMIMKMTGMRTTAMSTKFGVNQSTVSLCGASVESVVYFMLSFLYETMWYIIFRYVINTAMVYLRFVYLCVRLFLRQIWIFYASYFVLKIWVWQISARRISYDSVIISSRSTMAVCRVWEKFIDREHLSGCKAPLNIIHPQVSSTS